MQEFKQLVLGELTIGYYLGAGFFAFLAIVLGLYLNSKKRNVQSSATPVKFSWRFLFWDNTKRIVVGMILMFIFFRFSPDIFGQPLSMWLALGIGFVLSLGVDYLIQLIKNKFDFMQMDREKIMEILKQKGIS